MDDDQLQLRKPIPPVTVRVIGAGEVSVFMVREDELNEIERGSPGSLMAGIANTLLSLFGGGLISFFLGTVPTDIYRFTALMAFTGVFFTVGIVLAILSWRHRKDTSDVIRRIRDRAKTQAGPQVTPHQLPQANMVIDVPDEESHG